ncbi:DUF4230 domain-containing protein [Xylanibacter ruminicola]|uniref:DUF4230 domain-containing protein n=1 Tax=Xylanibacter ruminicola TaxID=839 RepID=UPI00048B1B49|nr:DUF4230 domain-containing protein [Xylanibacter ruminicola]
MKQYKIVIGAVVLIAVVAIFFWVKSAFKGNYLEVGTNDNIEPTPTQIQSIRDIGEWEFLSVSAEEMVDTVRKGFFSDDELVRIYYGTLRLGIDMQQLSDGAITLQGDTLQATLPKVGLLDKDFIDEAKTKSFYESGKWTPQAHQALYQKAHRQMLTHCLTKENVKTAEVNAEIQVSNLFKSLGYKNVVLHFE